MSEIDRLQEAIEGCDAGVYAYGLIAARLEGDEQETALTCMAELRSERDRLAQRVLSLDGTPVAAAAAYVPPSPVTDAASARALAALIEDRLAGQFAALAASSSLAPRSFAARTAQARAVRVVEWSGEAPIWNGAV